MPPAPRITRDMILSAAFALAREQGIQAVNARAIAQRLGCSTQPVLYWFDHMEDVRRAVYQMADEMHSTYLMTMPEDSNPMLCLGLNYIRFAAKERHLFQLLFQTNSFDGQGITQLFDSPDIAPMLAILQQETGLTAPQTKQVFKALYLLVHGYASMLANNTMTYDESEIIPMLQMTFMGMIGAMKMEE